MKIYDNLIIGSSFSAVGYAISAGNSLICEETEMCDPWFCYRMKCYSLKRYLPETNLGKELFELFTNLGILRENEINAGAIESGLCTFLSKYKPEILLKCRVLEYKKTKEDIYKVKILTNSGIENVYTKRVIETNFKPFGLQHYITVLYTAESSLFDELTEVFKGSYVEKAFYNDHYAVHIPCGENSDINDVNVYVHDEWQKNQINGKILYIAPDLTFEAPSRTVGVFPTDFHYDNPIEAFEGGIFLANRI